MTAAVRISDGNNFFSVPRSPLSNEQVSSWYIATSADEYGNDPSLNESAQSKFFVCFNTRSACNRLNNKSSDNFIKPMSKSRTTERGNRKSTPCTLWLEVSASGASQEQEPKRAQAEKETKTEKLDFQTAIHQMTIQKPFSSKLWKEK